MLDTAKLLGLFAVGRQIADQVLLRRFLSSLATLLILLVISGILLGSLIIGALYGAYLLLLIKGVAPFAAFLTVAGLLIFCAIVTLLLTLNHARRTMTVSRFFKHIEDAVAERVMPVAEAFLDGLMTRPKEND